MESQSWIQLGIYVVTLIWGAATMKSELRHLRQDMSDFKETVTEASKLVADTLTNHAERISRIEGRLRH